MRNSGIGTIVSAALMLAASSGQAQGTRHPGVVSPVPASARQMLLVVTPSWDTTSGTMRRYVRPAGTAKWRLAGAAVPVVVGSSGLAWGSDTLGTPDEPHKREGDGRSPAGIFPLGSAFGFAPSSAMSHLRLPYLPLVAGTECVDDTSSVRYNSIVNRDRVSSVDWSSSEHMRRIAQYQVGVLVEYNTRPARKGHGSCMFLHIWEGPGSSTAGCTAFPRADVESLLGWLDAERRPVLVQLPAAEYARRKKAWALP